MAAASRKFRRSLLSAPEGVVAHNETCLVSDHPGRFAATPRHEEGNHCHRIVLYLCDYFPLMPNAVTLCFPMWTLLPFIAMLLSIAIVPMVFPGWWDSNRNKTMLSVALSLPVLALIVPCDPNLLKHSLLDYFSF